MFHDVRWIVGVFLVVALVGREISAQEKPPVQALAPDRLAAIDRISSDSLKGHLSFLASDLLEGRDTPSKGLDLAAEYIAAQFRRAGLEPVGDDGYFQTANWAMLESDRSTFVMEVKGPDSTLKLKAGDVALTGARTFQIKEATLFKVDFRSYTELNRDDLVNKVLLVELPDTKNLPRGERNAAMTSAGVFRAWASSVKASALIVVSREPVETAGQGNGFLFDPQASDTPERLARLDPSGRLPIITVQSPELIKILETNPVGPIPLTVSTGLGEPVRKPVKIRNVVGVLRGSDPVLKETCVMVTAHYDHIGVRGPEGSDRIFNGANDDGSGTVSVVELASALSTLKERPKRSILFVTFFGEEKGLLGSRYYGKHPIFPIEKTVADVNLEQVGRTDDTEGPQLNRASLTGFGYSGVSTAFVNAGEAEGVQVVKHPRNSDAFFGRSDNQALADLGVPAHTLCVAFVYPDYHGAADHWDKVDYANMAKIDRTVARALLILADDPEEPKWDESNPRAARYLKAWKDRRSR